MIASVTQQQTPPPSTRAQRFAWVLYDWANSAFGFITIGVVFSTYFTARLVPLVADETRRGVTLGGTFVPGDALVGVLAALTALLVVLTAPALGALADLRGWSKRLFVASAAGGAVVGLVGAPFLTDGRWLAAALMYVVGGALFGTSFTFYNAYLSHLAPTEQQGRLSGQGYAAGYVGGGLALVIALALSGLGVLGPRGMLAFGAGWWLAFSIPAFVLLPSVPPAAGEHGARGLRSVARAYGRVFETLRHLRRYGALFAFLVAFLIYTNGTDTVINLAPAFATQTLAGATEAGVQKTFLAIQFVAFPGALLCGWLADRYGNKPVIVGTLLVWCAAVAAVPMTRTLGQFAAVGAVLGLVLGGLQSASRSLMSKLAPSEIHAEAFGFFSLSGKALSVVGPVIYALVTTYLGSRWGVLAVGPFLVVGLVLVLRVKEPPVPSPGTPEEG